VAIEGPEEAAVSRIGPDYRLCCPVCVDPESGEPIDLVTTAGPLRCPLCGGERTVSQEVGHRYDVGRDIYRTRVANEVTLRQAAALVGISPRELSDVEYGRCADEARIDHIGKYWIDNEERHRFERWYALNAVAVPSWIRSQRAGQTYDHPFLSIAWASWQAAKGTGR